MKSKMFIKNKSFRAFTLAEVLIVLAIIGVIAALTIPSLMNNIADMQYHSAWKKAFAEMNQASLMIMNDNSGTMQGLFTSNDAMRDAFASHMKVAQKCDSGSTLDNCWNINWYYRSGTNANDGTAYYKDGSRMVLSDGFFVYFNDNKSDCANITSSTPPDGICGSFTIDVNGTKGPNKYGKDIWPAWIQAQRIAPGGSRGDGFSTNGGADDCKTGTGLGCSAYYLYN